MARVRIALKAVVCAAGLVFVATAAVFALEGRTPRMVARVIDGDTIELDGGERVRLIGINAPEYELWKPRIDPYGKESLGCAKRWMDHKKVLLENDVERLDKYGRTLAYVFSEDGDFINRALVAEGCAKVRYYAPNGRYYKILKEAEKNAKAEHKGLWATVD